MADLSMVDSDELIVVLTEDNITVIMETPVQVGSSGGDMTKYVYDTNYNGLVDTCEYVDGGTF